MHDMFGQHKEHKSETGWDFKVQIRISQNFLSLWISFSGKDKKIRENLERVQCFPYPS